VSRPIHLRLPYLGLAFIGGALGTAAREAISLGMPAVGDVPWAILTVNVLGAFLLGLLLDGLARGGPDEGWRRRIRIMVGTGFMGGFTTYSALAADTAGLLGAGPSGASSPGVGIAYGLGTVLIGGLATFAGIATATALHRRRSSEPPQPNPQSPTQNPPQTDPAAAQENSDSARGGEAK
jgi:CrcB protein